MDMNRKNCPYCGKPLEEGRICSIESRAPYWLPGESYLRKSFVSNKAVEEVQGKVIGTATRLGFFQKQYASFFLLNKGKQRQSLCGTASVDCL